MSKNFLPGREAELVDWMNQFETKLEAKGANYGPTPVQIAAFKDAVSVYNAAYTVATDPETRSPSKIVAKKAAKKTAVTEARLIARIIQANPAVSSEQKKELGLTVREGGRIPKPVPSSSPVIKIIKTQGRIVTIELSQTKARRGKPSKVAGATIFTFAGQVAPQGADGWKFVENTTRTTVEIPFPPSSTGDTIWITAFWSNSRDESGPAAAPISIALPAGGVLPKEAGESMKLAA